jgi:beta-ureidopropionase
MYYVGAINRVGIEPLGENDFYGQSYFVDPEASSSATSATRTSPS